MTQLEQLIQTTENILKVYRYIATNDENYQDDYLDMINYLSIKEYELLNSIVSTSEGFMILNNFIQDQYKSDYDAYETLLINDSKYNNFLIATRLSIILNSIYLRLNDEYLSYFYQKNSSVIISSGCVDTVTPVFYSFILKNAYNKNLFNLENYYIKTNLCKIKKDKNINFSKIKEYQKMLAFVYPFSEEIDFSTVNKELLGKHCFNDFQKKIFDITVTELLNYGTIGIINYILGCKELAKNYGIDSETLCFIFTVRLQVDLDLLTDDSYIKINNLVEPKLNKLLADDNGIGRIDYISLILHKLNERGKRLKKNHEL